MKCLVVLLDLQVFSHCTYADRCLPSFHQHEGEKPSDQDNAFDRRLERGLQKVLACKLFTSYVLFTSGLRHLLHA